LPWSLLRSRPLSHPVTAAAWRCLAHVVVSAPLGLLTLIALAVLLTSGLILTPVGA
jgi:hypothetical protein